LLLYEQLTFILVNISNLKFIQVVLLLSSIIETR